MENEKGRESIFEQENYEGGMGSGPLAVASQEDDDMTETEDDEAGNERDEELDIDA